jgi:CRISPR/Cas system CMR-associated protein Cmr5 small subunit
MKLFQLVLAVLLIGFFGCQHSNNEIIIVGKITGKIPEKVEYTSPINGICNWGFTESVRPDSLGNFKIKIESDQTLFVKLRTSYTEQGTLIVEPGKTYTVAFDLNKKENVFSVTDKSSIIQDAYNKFPNPPHIQMGATEFQRDSVISRIKATVEQRRSAEIGVFEKFLSDKVISQNVFDFVKTDRNCYYDAVLATTAWIKDYMFIQRGLKVFTPDVENLWKETFKNPLFSNPKIVNSPWFNFYAECYIYFKEYTNGNFTKE